MLLFQWLKEQYGLVINRDKEWVKIIL